MKMKNKNRGIQKARINTLANIRHLVIAKIVRNSRHPLLGVALHLQHLLWKLAGSHDWTPIVYVWTMELSLINDYSRVSDQLCGSVPSSLTMIESYVVCESVSQSKTQAP